MKHRKIGQNFAEKDIKYQTKIAKSQQRKGKQFTCKFI